MILSNYFPIFIATFQHIFMEKLNVIIADDEDDALEILSSLLLDTKKVNILKQINKPLDIESNIITLKPDALFLDIQMPVYSGINLLKNIRTHSPALPVIFITGHDKFVLEATNLNAFAYLLKPINRELLNLTLNRIINYHNQINKNQKFSSETRIKLPVKNGLILVEFSEIISLIAEGNYTKINLLKDKSYISSYNLGRLFSKLPTHLFERINRSTVINISYLKEINRRTKKCTIIAGNKTEYFPVSSTFLHSIGKYFQI